MKPELPDLRQAMIEQSDVDDLFRDLSLLCEVLDVRSRGGRDQEESTVSLEAARNILRETDGVAIQLRYVYDERDWIDTLVRVGNGVQLTRLAHSLSDARDPEDS